MFKFLIVLLALAVVLQIKSVRNALASVRYHTTVSKLIVNPDEAFEVVSVIENTRRWPLLFIEMQESLPAGIELKADGLYTVSYQSGSGRADDAILKLYSTIYLMPRQRLKRRIPASLPARGRYTLQGASFWRGDFFGFRQTFRRFDCLSEIVVVPAPAGDLPALCALGGFLGNVSVRRFVMEDPIFTVGFHDYTGREPQKDISWMQSAKAGRLIVRQYDHTLEPSVTVLLNVECAESGQDAALLERCFSLARTVCEHLEKQGVKYAFLTNATTAGVVGRWSAVADGLGNQHLNTILEGLGRATYDCTEPFEQTVERAVQLAESGRSHIIVTPYGHPALGDGVDRLRAVTGGEAAVIPAEAG